jgi:SAM-dependent methyltransferase
VLRRLHHKAVFGRRVTVLASHLVTALTDCGTVLDLGCGDGSVAAQMLHHRPDLRVTGIDVLVRPETSIPVAPFDGRTIPFGDSSFDAVTLVDVLHHVADPEPLLREAARVTRNTVVVKDHLADEVLARPTLRLMDWFGNASHGVALPYNYWTRDRWAQALDTTGLTITHRVDTLGLYPMPASLIFDRGMHFVWRLEPTQRTRTSR